MPMFNRFLFIFLIFVTPLSGLDIHQKLAIADQFEYVLERKSTIEGVAEVVDRIREGIISNPTIDQNGLYRLINSNYRLLERDHTELGIIGEMGESELPFMVVRVEGKYHIGAIYDLKDFLASLDGVIFDPIGDEIISWNGRSIEEIVEEIRHNHIEFHVNPNSGLTAACEYLTKRCASKGMEMSMEYVDLALRRKDTEDSYLLRINWNENSYKTIEKGFDPTWGLDCFTKKFKSADTKSLKRLTKKIRAVSADIFKMELKNSSQNEKKKIAYLQIEKFPDFSTEEIARLDKVIRVFEKRTDGMILDLRDNGGGYVSGMRKLLTFLTDVQMEPIPLKEKKIIGKEYVSDIETISEPMKTREKKIFSKSVSVSGKRIDPSDSLSIYSKPIIVLVDEGTSSSGEVAAYSLQWNRRAKVFGAQTGYGISTIKTETIPFFGKSLEINFPKSKLEEGSKFNGVVPDIPYSLQLGDLEGKGMQPYLKALFEEMEKLL